MFSLDGPLLVDGVINEFDLEPQPGQIVIPSGPFTVSLEFANDNANDPFAPSVVHDGNGCQNGKNFVYAIPGGWNNACALGVSGDWVMYAIYRRVNCPTGVGEELVLGGGSPALMSPRPNPAADGATIEFYLPQPERGTIAVFDVAGREVGRIVDDRIAAGRHRVAWDGRGADGAKLRAGLYVLELRVGDRRITRKLAIVER